MTDRSDEQIGIAVVVDVGERAPDRDLVGHGQPGAGGDVLEATIAQVLPQLAGTELGHEIEIGETVAVDVRGAQSAAVVVVRELVALAGVVDDPILERDAARLPLIREAEVVQHRRTRRQLGFLASSLGQPCRCSGRATRGQEEREGDEECGAGG